MDTIRKLAKLDRPIKSPVARVSWGRRRVSGIIRELRWRRTLKAIRDTDAGVGVKRYETPADMYADLGI